MGLYLQGLAIGLAYVAPIGMQNLFNPQALIDGTLLFGSFRVGHPGGDSTLLVLGAATASCLWFSGVTLLISVFSARFNDRVLRLINVVCGSVILIYGLRLILQFLRSI